MNLKEWVEVETLHEMRWCSRLKPNNCGISCPSAGTGKWVTLKKEDMQKNEEQVINKQDKLFYN